MKIREKYAYFIKITRKIRYASERIEFAVVRARVSRYEMGLKDGPSNDTMYLPRRTVFEVSSYRRLPSCVVGSSGGLQEVA